MKWQIWPLIRDVLVTGTGLALIISQAFARSPSDVLLMAALTLTTPSLIAHAGTLLGAPSRSESSSSSSSPGSPRSTQPGASDEAANGVGPGK